MKIIEEKDFKQSGKITKLPRGGIWEENEIEIVEDYCASYAKKVNCPHVKEEFIKRTTRTNGSFFDTVCKVYPRVIIAKNEGGYNTTGVCLDCVLEQLNLS